MQASILKITKKNQEHVLYTIKIQKWVEPTVDESVLKTTGYAKQTASHTIQHSITHISPRPTPHFTYIHFTTQPTLIPFPFPPLADLQSGAKL